MSLILDALKKAEQDRHAGQAPVIDEMLIRTRPVTARRRNPQQDVVVMAAIIASGLFALAGVVYWLWPTAPKTVAVAVTAAPLPAAELAPAAPLRVDPERLEAAVSDAPEAAVELGDTEAAEAMTMDELDGEVRASAPNKPMLAAPPATALSESPASAATTSQASSQRSEPPAVRPLKEMPPAFRSEFPKLSLDIHVYDDNPLRRFALINGKKYRETDTLLDGPRVLEIRPDGVVLEQRGSRVLLELPR